MSFFNTDQEILIKQIAEILIENEETVLVAESSSGGLVSASLLSVPGNRFIT